MIIKKYSIGLVTELLSIGKSMMENTNIKYSVQRNVIGAGCALVVAIGYLTKFMPGADILPGFCDQRAATIYSGPAHKF